MDTEINFSPALEQHLAAFAANRESMDELRNAILDEIEDALDLQLAEETMERVRNGTEKMTPLEEVGKRLGLED